MILGRAANLIERETFFGMKSVKFEPFRPGSQRLIIKRLIFLETVTFHVAIEGFIRQVILTPEIIDEPALQFIDTLFRIQERQDGRIGVIRLGVVVDRMLVVRETLLNGALRDGGPPEQQVQLGFQIDICRLRINIAVDSRCLFVLP